jgi:hypothetical protein
MQLINHVRKFTRLSSLLSTALLLASAFVSSQVYAASTITSAQSGDWATTTTWTGGVVPAATDSVIIANGHTVTITTMQRITDVTVGQSFGGGATLTLQSSSGFLRVKGTVDVSTNAATWTAPTAGMVEFNNELGQNNVDGFMRFFDLRLAGGSSGTPSAGATLSMPGNTIVTGDVQLCMPIGGGNYVTVDFTQIILTGNFTNVGCGTSSPESTKNIFLALQPVAHTIGQGAGNTMKLAEMLWSNPPLTAPVTLTFTGTVDVAASLASLSGADTTNFVTLSGGTLNGTGVISNCKLHATTPTTLTGGVTCSAPTISNPVSAPIFSLKDKPAIFSEEVK